MKKGMIIKLNCLRGFKDTKKKKKKAPAIKEVTNRIKKHDKHMKS